MVSGVAALNDPYTFFIPVLTDPNGPWQTGSGTIGAFVGTASFAGNVMTIQSMTSGSVQQNMAITASGVSTTVSNFGTGTGNNIGGT